MAAWGHAVGVDGLARATARVKAFAGNVLRAFTPRRRRDMAAKPSVAEITDQLARIVASDQFEKAEVLRELLVWIITKAP